MERTLGIIKPNAVRKNLIGKILAMIEAEGLEIVSLKMTRLRNQQAWEFYKEHYGKPFFNSLADFMCSGPVVVAVLQGENAIERYRKLMGATDPSKAEAGSIRALYADSLQENAVHGSDGKESAKREVAFFFPEFELV